MQDIPIIDAHHHFWDLRLEKHPWLIGPEPIPFRYGNYDAIRRNYLLPDYLADSAGHNVVKSVHMEAEWDPADPVGETEWLWRHYDDTGWPHAIVAQAWFGRDDIAAVLEAQAGCPLVRSIRQKPAAAPVPEDFVASAQGSLADPAFRAGYRLLAGHGLHFDLQTPWWHLGEAADLARDFPDTLIILNHTGLPADRSPEMLSAWADALESFAQWPNTAIKISGICVPGQKWTADLNRDVVLRAIEIFGADRAMVASNFPVDSLWATFDEIFAGLKEITAGFSSADQRRLFYDTADRIYRPL